MPALREQYADRDSARIDANRHTGGLRVSTMKYGFVRNVIASIQSIVTHIRSTAPKIAENIQTQKCVITGVQRVQKQQSQPVYNLEVEEHPEFLVAIGDRQIVVHNCLDVFRYITMSRKMTPPTAVRYDEMQEEKRRRKIMMPLDARFGGAKVGVVENHGDIFKGV
jgi:hypothetical protein